MKKVKTRDKGLTMLLIAQIYIGIDIKYCSRAIILNQMSETETLEKLKSHLSLIKSMPADKADD